MKLKRYIVFSFLAVTLLLCLCACGGEEEPTEPELFTVTFDSQGGTEIPSQQIAKGEKVVEPPTPVREGYIFHCWKNEKTNSLWSFTGSIVEADVTLRAEWIEASRIFEIEAIDEGETACLTGISDRERKEYPIPAVINGFSVVSIGEDAFSGLDSALVSKISLPETVTRIEARAFADCDGIEITVGGKVTFVGEQAFKNCDRLKELTFGEGLSEISAEAFWGCSALKEIRLPSSVLSIGENAFEECSAMNVIQLWDRVETVGNSAFLGCNALKVIYFRGDENRLETLLETAEEMNGPFVDCEKIYLYSETSPEKETGFEGYWYLDENNKFRLWKTE